MQRGDKVVGYVPNCALSVEAMLAAVSLGAIWSSASPDFGVTGVLDRFSQIKPKVIFSVDGVRCVLIVKCNLTPRMSLKMDKFTLPICV